jgi:hypothetical protein
MLTNTFTTEEPPISAELLRIRPYVPGRAVVSADGTAGNGSVVEVLKWQTNLN